MIGETPSPSLRLIQQLAGDPDQHAVGKRRLQTRLGELVQHLGDSQAVVLPQVVEQAQGVVLGRQENTYDWFIGDSEAKFEVI